jgi:hypothetical protein
LVTWLSSPSAVDWEEGGVRTGLFPVLFSFLLPSRLTLYSGTSWWTTTAVADDGGGGGRRRRWWWTAAAEVQVVVVVVVKEERASWKRNVADVYSQQATWISCSTRWSEEQ